MGPFEGKRTLNEKQFYCSLVKPDSLLLLYIIPGSKQCTTTPPSLPGASSILSSFPLNSQALTAPGTYFVSSSQSGFYPR